MSSVIGIDIGGTKTHVAVASRHAGTEIREFVVPSASWRRTVGDPVSDALALRELIRGSVGAEALRLPWAVGAHGCENTGQCRALESALTDVVEGPVLVVNDSELIAPTMGAGRAIGLVVGTGSIATARDEGARLVTAGGWGSILGDEGSAPAIVREATRAVLGDLDRGRGVDPLGKRLMASFGARDADELALAVTQAASAEAWGRHAPEVFAAADEGSVLAIDVIRDAADSLAQLVRVLCDRGIAVDSVVAGGSVIQRQPRLQNELRDALARNCPQLTLTILDRPPVHGAIALAREFTSSTKIGDLTK
jgi:N-acetylglucosamine kinase-like BadF-type ATPase